MKTIRRSREITNNISPEQHKHDEVRLSDVIVTKNPRNNDKKVALKCVIRGEGAP